MRELNVQEAALVAGGNGLPNGGVDAGPAQADDRYITVTYQSTTNPTVTLTAKCVDYLRELESADPGPESGA